MEFNVDAPKTRVSDKQIVEALRRFSEETNNSMFSTKEYDSWTAKPCRSETVIKRFGSWHDARIAAGLPGGRKKTYSPEELMENLRVVWEEIGRPPGKRLLSKYGRRISERPYNNQWGSVEKACRLLSNYENGRISEAELLRTSGSAVSRRSISLKTRWKLLKNAAYTCCLCGASPANDTNVELHIDHIIPVSHGGGDEESNLRVLCASCNLGRGNDSG